MIRNLLISVVLFLLLVLLGCNSFDNFIFGEDKKASKGYIAVDKSGCLSTLHKSAADSNEFANPYTDSTFVKSVTRDDEITHILVHYQGNCCADYADSVVIQNENVDVYLKNVGDQCWCICTYEDDFIFNLDNRDQIHFRFHLTDSPGRDYTTLIDSVLVLP